MTKKIFFLAIAAIGILIGCQNKTAYTVNGSVVNPDYEGTYVYLYEDRSFSSPIIDSAIIRNGKFSFRGNIEKPLLVSATLDMKATKPKSELGRTILIEPGTTTMLFDSTITVTGSQVNEDYTTFKAKERICLIRLNVLTAEYEKRESEGTLTREYEKEFQKEYDKTYSILKQHNAEFISKHIDSELGKKSLFDKIKMFTPEQQRELLSKTDEEFKQQTKIADLIKKLNEPEKAAVGTPFIDVKMQDVNGKEVALSDYVGKSKITLLDFWASWCMPCVKAIPHLKEVYKTYKGKGLEIVGISMDHVEASWKNAIEQYQIPWNNISELSLENIGSKVYGISGIPHVVVIDQDGIIIAKNPGKEELETLLEERLNNR